MKRILSSILVVVMLVLSIVGCGYSVEDDEMNDYATLDKAAFEALLQKIAIEDGDFTTDAETRNEKVWESIYAALAEAIGTDAPAKTEGTPKNRDVIYYSYYAKATVKNELTTDDENDTVEVFIYTSMMKSDSATKIQLGVKFDEEDDKFALKLLEIIGEHDFTNSYYKSVTSTNAVSGEFAFVTFTVTGSDNVPVTYTNHPMTIGTDSKFPALANYLIDKGIGQYGNISQFEEKDAEGKVINTYSNIKIDWVSSRVSYGTAELGDKVYVSYKEKIGDADATSVSRKEIIISDEENNFAKELLGKEIGKTLTKKDGETTTNLTYEFTNAENKKVVYSDIKIEWKAGDNQLGSFFDVTFDEETIVKDTEGVERDLNGAPIEYYIYPVHYKETPDFTSERLINDIIGKDIDADTLLQIIFANEFAKLDDDASDDEIDAVKALAADYKVSTDYEIATLQGLTIANLAEKIAKYYTDIEDLEKALESANKALADAQSKYNAADSALKTATASGDAAKIEEAQAAFDEANIKLNGKADEAEDKKTGAKADQARAQKAHDDAEKSKEDSIKALFAITKTGSEDGVTLEKKIYDGYQILMYNALQDSYNEEIKTNLAREIYYFLTESVTLNGELPEDLVDDAYNQIFEKYESDFYTGTDSATKLTNYKLYEGSFDKFLIDIVSTDIKEVKTVKEAKAAITEKAEKSASDIVKIFLVAQEYDVVITDSDYEEFKDKLEEYYYYYILYYKNFDIEEMIGVNNIKTAAQFNKLFDFFLDFEETEPAIEGMFSKIEYKYTNTIFQSNEDGKPYEFGTPASDAAKDAE